MTRWLVGVGGGALALEGLRRRGVTGSFFAGLGGTLVWWALTGQGDLATARRWFADTLERAPWRTGGSGVRSVGRFVPRERRPVLHADGRARASARKHDARATDVESVSPSDRVEGAVDTDRPRGSGRQLPEPRGAARLLFLSGALPGAAVSRRADQLPAGQRAARRRSPRRWRAWRPAMSSASSRSRSSTIAHDENSGLLTLGMLGTIWSMSSGDGRHHQHAEPGIRHSGKPPLVEGQAEGDWPDPGAGRLHRHLDGPGDGRADARREGGGAGSTSGPAFTLGLEHPPVAGRLRPGHAGASPSSITTRRTPNRSGSGLRPGRSWRRSSGCSSRSASSSTSRTSRPITPPMAPSAASSCCCCGFTSRASPCSSAPSSTPKSSTRRPTARTPARKRAGEKKKTRRPGRARVGRAEARRDAQTGNRARQLRSWTPDLLPAARPPVAPARPPRATDWALFGLVLGQRALVALSKLNRDPRLGSRFQRLTW